MVKKRKPNIGEGIRKGDEEFGLGNEEIEIAQCSVCGAMGILGQTMTLNIEGKPVCYFCQNPSEATNGYWIFASRRKGKYPKPSPRSGKWLIFVNIKDICEVWAKIRKATEEGKLGAEAKVSTAKSKPADIGYKKDEHVICVYTYDWTDEKDVERIREELRKLGITNKIPYKADEDTGKGRYAARGHKRISKYYE